MRSSTEIAFRLRQELANFLYFLRPPCWTAKPPKPLEIPSFPVAKPFSDTLWPVLGFEVNVSERIQWRQDPISGKTSGLNYFRSLPYLDYSVIGDHKKIWELNRHQHLAVLASEGKLELVCRLLGEWLEQNPFHRGINWASALEVAFRALSWLSIWSSASGKLPVWLQGRFLDSLYGHGLHLEYNLSTYFSPNTHLLGEATALHAIGLFFGIDRWKSLGRETVLQCLKTQVHPDGSYFEQSTYYHVYALDFFLLHHLLEPVSPIYQETMSKMGLYLQALLGEAGELPGFGDDDGGRLYHPFAPHCQFGRDTLQMLWPSGPAMRPLPRFFPDAGMILLENSNRQIVFDAGPFASGSAGHSHSDALSFTARNPQGEILIDPGTFTYVADPEARNLFRGSAMHNTVRVGDLDQATAAGPFRWMECAEVRILNLELDSPEPAASASCAYQGFIHTRSLRWNPKELKLEVTDRVEGPSGRHRIEQFWHFASSSGIKRLTIAPLEGFSLSPSPAHSVRSRVFAQQESAPTLCFSGLSRLPIQIKATLDLS